MKTICSPIFPSGLSRLAAAIGLLLSPFHLQAAEAPGLMKAKSLPSSLLASSGWEQYSIHDFYVSEKLDGIRAFWTGHQLVTRSGKAISAPDWFTASLPGNVLLDGELWGGRSSFEQVAATVMDHSPNDEQWKQIKYMVFDLPSSNGRFERRLVQLDSVITGIDHPHIQLVPQQAFDNPAALADKLAQITEATGEGLMLQHKDNIYQQGRSDRLLKLKPHQDAEAIVIGYEEGKGKYQGKMGAIWVLTADNIKFKIGSGFTEAEREHPPRLGAIISYRYNGYTSNGIPRFARYLKQRQAPDI